MPFLELLPLGVMGVCDREVESVPLRIYFIAA